jgi:hypothetical protein
MMRLTRLSAWIVPIWILWELTSLSGPKWQGRTPPDSEVIRDAYDTKACRKGSRLDEAGVARVALPNNSPRPPWQN